MPKPEVIRTGILDMQVRVPKDLTDEQVEDFANKEICCCTQGTDGKRKEGNERLGGMPERNHCSERVGFVHITLEA